MTGRPLSGHERTVVPLTRAQKRAAARSQEAAARGEQVKLRRAAQRHMAALRRDLMWRERLARAGDSRRLQAQVWYDRLRSLPGQGCPDDIKAQVWETIVTELADLVGELETGIGRRRDNIRARGETIRPRKLRRWWDWL